MWEFNVYFDTGKALLRAKKLEEVIDAEPNFEATALLAEDELELFAGRIISQEQGYDDERDEHLSNIYYFEHSSIESFRAEITEVHSDWIKAKLSGKATINNYADEEPDAELLTTPTVFRLDLHSGRRVM